MQIQPQSDFEPFQILGGMLALFFGVCALAYLHQIGKELRLIKGLIAAFMEHKVSGTVAENKLASAVQEASKKSAWE